MHAQEAPPVRQLTDQVRCPVWVPGQEGYVADTAGFNTIVTHRPAVVVGATLAGDVAAAVRFAGDHDLPVAVQATGHGVVAPATDALLVSTRRMTGLVVDPRTRLARAGAGVRWDHVIRTAGAYA